jgi:hypothetical protein
MVDDSPTPIEADLLPPTAKYFRVPENTGISVSFILALVSFFSFFSSFFLFFFHKRHGPIKNSNEAQPCELHKAVPI